MEFIKLFCKNGSNDTHSGPPPHHPLFNVPRSHGQKIHLTRKHTRIEQMDGNATDSEDEDEKYSSTKFYWEKGKLGTFYQVFKDADDVSEQSDLSEDGRKSPKS